jgi:hypothetical protein
VSNWNQDRLDHGRAEGYHRRLHAELMTDQRNIDNVVRFCEKVAGYGESAIANGETGALAHGSNWKLLA